MAVVSGPPLGAPERGSGAVAALELLPRSAPTRVVAPELGASSLLGVRGAVARPVAGRGRRGRTAGSHRTTSLAHRPRRSGGEGVADDRPAGGGVREVGAAGG